MGFASKTELETGREQCGAGAGEWGAVWGRTRGTNAKNLNGSEQGSRNRLTDAPECGKPSAQAEAELG